MKYLFFALHSTVLFCPLLAEENESSESDILYFELGEISVPFSFYTEDWDPTQKLLPILSDGTRVQEKDLIADLDASIKESRKEQDLLRSQHSWLSEVRCWPFYAESHVEYYEEAEDEDFSE